MLFAQWSTVDLYGVRTHAWLAINLLRARRSHHCVTSPLQPTKDPNQGCFLFSKTSVWNVDLYNHTNIAEDIYVHDGDVIEPKMDVDGEKYLTTYEQTWRLEEDKGHWELTFEFLDIELSDNCSYDYLRIKERE